MAILRQVQLLLTYGSLALAAVKGNSNGGEDDDDDTPLPLVIWHGLGDNYAAEGLRLVGELAEETNPGTLVYFVRMDENANQDRADSFVGNLTEQVDKVCADLAADPILSTAPAIDALGFSQGGQFLRAYVERCNQPPVRSLVTFGSQHNGVIEFMDCKRLDLMCHSAMMLLHSNTWSDYVQGHLVPAQYFRDPSTPEAYAQYLEHSNFLADINNERPIKNATYKANLASLTNFVMYLFEDDTTSIPTESSWFAEVNGTVVLPLRARPVYYEDWLGLRTIDHKGGLHFRSVPGAHMQIEKEDLVSVFTEFYGPLNKTFPAATLPVSDSPGEL